MGRTSKGFSLLFAAILAASSLMMVESASGQSVPKPSVPEFTIKYIDNSYDTEVSYSIDPYTGANITNPSIHVDNRTLEFRIKNQPFTPFHDSYSSFDIILYYNVRMKGHFEENWTNLYLMDDSHPQQSTIDYTLIPLALGASSNTPLRWLPSNATVDFQVQAMIGYFHRDASTFWAPWVFDGETSGWSNTQTIAIPETSTSISPSPNSTPTPTVPEFPILVILPLFLSMFLIANKLLRRKQPSNGLKLTATIKMQWLRYIGIIE